MNAFPETLTLIRDLGAIFAIEPGRGRLSKLPELDQRICL